MHLLGNVLRRPSLGVRPHISSCHSRSLSLAYILHKSPENQREEKTNNVLVLHGLFGSKANAKTISQ